METLSEVIMNKQTCIRECNSYASETCTYCQHLPTQQGSLQLSEGVGGNSSLILGGGVEDRNKVADLGYGVRQQDSSHLVVGR